jgi:hypothetical protein
MVVVVSLPEDAEAEGSRMVQFVALDDRHHGLLATIGSVGSEAVESRADVSGNNANGGRGCAGPALPSVVLR